MRTRRKKKKRITKTTESLQIFKSLYNRYASNAKRRGLLFDLTYEDFEVLVTQNCYYCGDKPNQSLCRNDKHKSLIALYHGVDRVNNQKGYSYTNCVTACKTCNVGKHVLDVDDFLAMVEKIYINLIKPHKRSVR